MVPIVQNGDPALRKIAKEVPEKAILSPRIAEILELMKAALDSEEDGVAIAAPQIGKSLRIFVVSKRAFEISPKASKSGGEKNDKSKRYGHIVFINPVIDKLSKERKLFEEGCLSVRHLYGKISRSAKATVTALDEHGKKFTRGGSGLAAQIFQHEIDHLNGVLFIDKATDVKKIPPERQSHESQQG